MKLHRIGRELTPLIGRSLIIKEYLSPYGAGAGSRAVPGDGTRRHCYRFDDIVARVGWDVSDGGHGLGVMKKPGRGRWGFAALVFLRFQIEPINVNVNVNGSGQECPHYTCGTVRLGYLRPNEYAARETTRYGKDACQKTASLENAEERVSHFPAAPATAGDMLETSQDQNVVGSRERN